MQRCRDRAFVVLRLVRSRRRPRCSLGLLLMRRGRGEKICMVHDEDNTYGAPRITAELNDGVPDDHRVNHKRVARVMRGAGIAGYRRKRRVKTTVADPANQKVPDLLGRDFTAAQVNTRYVGDITYRPLGTGWNLTWRR